MQSQVFDTITCEWSLKGCLSKFHFQWLKAFSFWCFASLLFSHLNSIRFLQIVNAWNSEGSELLHQSPNKIYSKHKSKRFQLKTPTVETKSCALTFFNLPLALQLCYCGLIQWGLCKRIRPFRHNKFSHTDFWYKGDQEKHLKCSATD